MIDSISGTHSKERSGPCASASRIVMTNNAAVATRMPPPTTRASQDTTLARVRRAGASSWTWAAIVASWAATSFSPRCGKRAWIRSPSRTTVTCTWSGSRRVVEALPTGSTLTTPAPPRAAPGRCRRHDQLGSGTLPAVFEPSNSVTPVGGGRDGSTSVHTVPSDRVTS